MAFHMGSDISQNVPSMLFMTRLCQEEGPAQLSLLRWKPIKLPSENAGGGHCWWQTQGPKGLQAKLKRGVPREIPGGLCGAGPEGLVRGWG